MTLPQMAARYGRFLVFDLHTYNHRRDGPEGHRADPRGTPRSTWERAP